MKQPKISIVTPSYNQAEFIEDTIDSVLSQNYPNLEFIIIDGGSTDGSQKIIKKYQKKIKFWASEPDKGQADAINKGFKESTGEIMGWLNSDDILMPGSLNLIADIFLKYKKINWITGQPISINSENNIVRTGIHSGKNRFLLKKGFYHGKALGFIGQEGTFWRRKLWNKTGKKVPNYDYALDFYLWKKFATKSQLTSVETPLGAFRINPKQKTSNLSKYYNEINPLLNKIPNKIGFVGRILHPILLRHLSPRIYYDKKNYSWKFKNGY